MLTIDEEEIELRDLDEDDDIPAADALGILPIATEEEPVSTVE